MKSRVNRARNRLADILAIHSACELGHKDNWHLGDPIDISHHLPKTGSD
jgi:RNA polymerase sigma-70 factor (ECF subfamily)